MELSTTGMRVLRTVAEAGSFTAAAARLGYTQSAVSRQAAVLERASGVRLFERRPDGVVLTDAGMTLLRHARTALDAVDAAARDLAGDTERVVPVRLGVFPSAGAVELPGVLAALAVTHPRLRVVTREGTTPALARALRAGTLDLALLSSRPPHRPPDAESPRLRLDVVADIELQVAVPASGRFAGRTAVHVDELVDVDWIASPSGAGESLMGVWPGLPGRPRIAHSARDWLIKLQLVAAGAGVTTVPPGFRRLVPDAVRLVRVDGAPPEVRRLLVARPAGRSGEAVAVVARALCDAG